MKGRFKKTLFFLLRFGITSFFILSLLAVDFNNPKDIFSVTIINRFLHPDLLYRIINQNLLKIGQLLKNSRVEYIAASFMIHLLCIGMLTFRWRILLKIQGITLKFNRLYAYYLIGFFFNNFLPTNIGGDVARVYYVGKPENKMPESFAAVFMDRFIGFITIFVLAIVAMSLHSKWFKNRPAIFAVLLFAFGIGAVFWILFDSSMRVRIKAIIGKVGFMHINEKLTRFYQVIQVFRGHTKTIAAAFVISVIYQLTLVVMNLFAAKAVGVSPTFMSLFFTIQITTLICLIPISINGLGVRETLYVKILNSSGIVSEKILVFQVILLIINYVESLLGGFCFMLKKGIGKVRELRANSNNN